MDINQKLQKLEKKIESLEVPAGYTISGASISIPWWVDALSQWLEFGVILTGFIIGILTIVLQIKKLKRK